MHAAGQHGETIKRKKAAIGPLFSYAEYAILDGAIPLCLPASCGKGQLPELGVLLMDLACYNEEKTAAGTARLWWPEDRPEIFLFQRKE